MKERKKIVEILKSYGIHIDVDDLDYLGNDIDDRIYQYAKENFWIRVYVADSTTGEAIYYFNFPKVVMYSGEDK